MDPIAGLLDGPRARRAFLLRCTLDPPWALHIRDEAPLSLVAMLRGRACFVLDEHEPEWLDRGDVAILLGPDHYLFADDPATAPQAIIHPDQRCTTPDGQEIPQLHARFDFIDKQKRSLETIVTQTLAFCPELQDTTRELQRALATAQTFSVTQA